MNQLKNWINSLTASERFSIILIKLFVIMVLYLCLARVDVTVQSHGTVVPEANTTSLDSMITGEITAVNFKQGDEVTVGDVIVVINQGVGYEPYNIIANINGIVQTLLYKNPGAVVKQGNPVVLLIPKNQKYVIESKLRINDRGYIKEGQPVKIRLANNDSIKFGSINGSIISISPDAVQSREGNYYQMRISVESQIFKSGNIEYKLVPGIDVLTFVITGERAIIEYLLSPIGIGADQALQEK